MTRRLRTWDALTWLMLAILVTFILAIILMIFLAKDPADSCGPLFPEIQLPTLGGDL